MLILQQCRNIALSIKRQATQSHTKPIDTSKLTTGYFIALQKEEIQLHLLEHRYQFPYPGPWQATSPTQPTGSNLHNKEEPQIFSIQKGHPKQKNLKKWKGREIFSKESNMINAHQTKQKRI